MYFVQKQAEVVDIILNNPGLFLSNWAPDNLLEVFAFREWKYFPDHDAKHGV